MKDEHIRMRGRDYQTVLKALGGAGQAVHVPLST